MNRMAPLIVRRPEAWAATLPAEVAKPFAGTDAASWLKDLRLFATGWIGGLVFFGTLFG
jgi:hypothetical protein